MDTRCQCVVYGSKSSRASVTCCLSRNSAHLATTSTSISCSPQLGPFSFRCLFAGHSWAARGTCIGARGLETVAAVASAAIAEGGFPDTGNTIEAWRGKVHPAIGAWRGGCQGGLPSGRDILGNNVDAPKCLNEDPRQKSQPWLVKPFPHLTCLIFLRLHLTWWKCSNTGMSTEGRHDRHGVSCESVA
jgi:hypothetical protein